MKSPVIKTESDIQTINLSNLIYAIHRDNNFVLFMRDEIYLMDGCFEDFFKNLPEQFISIYKQTIINLDFIEKIEPSKRRIIIEYSRCHLISKKKLASLCGILGVNASKYKLMKLEN